MLNDLAKFGVAKKDALQRSIVIIIQKPQNSLRKSGELFKVQGRVIRQRRTSRKQERQIGGQESSGRSTRRIYVHRTGRTGRAQNVGDAFTIMTGEHVEQVTKIEQFIGQKFSRLNVEGFDFLNTAMLDTTPRQPIRRTRPKRRYG